jgi:cyanophycin synthetase
MRRLTEFVDAYARDGKGGSETDRAVRTIGVIGIPGDRRDEDQREYGRLAGHSFDRIIVREDANLRGRPAGEAARNVLEGVEAAQREGGRSSDPAAILDEITAARAALAMAAPTDLVVMCVDDAAAVYREAMANRAGGRGAVAIADPGELEAEEG